MSASTTSPTRRFLYNSVPATPNTSAFYLLNSGLRSRTNQINNQGIQTSPEQRTYTPHYYRGPMLQPPPQPHNRSTFNSINRSNRRVEDAAQRPIDWTPLVGVFLLLATFGGFVVSMYAIVVSKLFGVGKTGNSLLDWIHDDNYYCYLIPLTIPITLFAVIINWMGMKLFRHN